MIVAGVYGPLAAAHLVPGVPLDEPWAVSRGWAGRIDWALLALTAAVLLALFSRMVRYRQPDGALRDLAGTVLALVYVGLMMSFLVRLRLGWGIGALASLVIVVKLGDTGAYTVGRLIGRHKLAPTLSPGKTIEGALGGFAFSAVGAWATFTWLVPWLAKGGPAADTVETTASAGVPVWGWLAFGLVVSLAGLLGDLAESLIKREAGQKDSSHWLPGFGGVLDILDSLLLASPVAYVFWATGLVGAV
ncbi:MAG: phosphatidate cytidylyltransferase [Pirellulales bacterium]|nr:phosphatidate cytidylyltransferase [Pirellulales bacterium]